MIYLQSFDSQQHLFHLVCFGFSLIILDTYSGITLPGCFVYSMSVATLTRFPEIVFTHSAQIIEPDIPRVPLHLYKYISYFGRGNYSIINDIIIEHYFSSIEISYWELGPGTWDLNMHNNTCAA
jgi:hypothetical protein